VFDRWPRGSPTRERHPLFSSSSQFVKEQHMLKSSLRRTMAVAIGGMALAGVVTAASPASAATKDGPPPTAAAPSAPAPTHVAGTSSTTSATSRNSGGVSSKHLDGYCNIYSSGYGDECLWYYFNYGGSLADFYFADANLNDNYFITPGAGQGQRVGNNAESYANYDQHLSALNWTDPNFNGLAFRAWPNQHGNFPYPYYDNIESISWL
jgi:hypothetical protein